MSKNIRRPFKKIAADKLVGSRKARRSKEAALVQVALDEGLRPQRELVTAAHVLGSQALELFDRTLCCVAELVHLHLSNEAAELGNAARLRQIEAADRAVSAASAGTLAVLSEELRTANARIAELEAERKVTH